MGYMNFVEIGCLIDQNPIDIHAFSSFPFYITPLMYMMFLGQKNVVSIIKNDTKLFTWIIKFFVNIPLISGILEG